MSVLRATRCLLTVPLSRAIRYCPAAPRVPLQRPATITIRTYTTTRSFQKAAKRDEPEDPKDSQSPVAPQFDKKTTARSTTTSKSSLRRAAAANDRNKTSQSGGDSESKLPTQVCTAYCTAEKYNLTQCDSLLKSGGYVPDPLSTGLGNAVIHLRLPLPPQAARHFPNAGADSYGDIFVFPSGNIVSWGLPEAIITSVAALIRPAAESPHSTTETETLEFVEDPSRSTSFLRGDVMIIGTGTNRKLEEDHHLHHLLHGTGVTTSEPLSTLSSPEWKSAEMQRQAAEEEESSRRQATPTVLAKIAFSSGLARSTKLAVLEELLQSYIESTSSIPALLSRGSRLPFTRNFILRKTGELLSFRARLNLYSELTDNLPDIFWDSQKELGLEGCYESVGRELDVGARIRQLNAKLDYASETAAVLREQLSERHGLVLEWMIIILITIEVLFEILHLWKDSKAEQRWDEIERENRPSPAAGSEAPYTSLPLSYPYPSQLPPQQHHQQHIPYQQAPHDYHRHHQHAHPQVQPHSHQHQPYREYHSASPPPQPPRSPQPPPSRDPAARMNDVDAALALLDVVMERLRAEEEELQKRQAKQWKRETNWRRRYERRQQFERREEQKHQQEQAPSPAQQETETPDKD
ncbi:hypothetical protein Dda_4697 [Drechslerella dactyloides]|uniref:DUF155 domain-containing protein n=1 Tax=Drechslerella dactyloides TaxID=74499 RepID=A0AAD6NI61_DREDA|nr:hypothetical protein Dda_4697 [Drechslerella dactyloides]